MAASNNGSTDSTIPPDVFPAPGAYPSDPVNDGGSPAISPQVTLAEAVERRRAEFTRQYSTKVKVGSWNVASLSGTEKDVAGWFIGGKGVSENLSCLASKSRASELDRVVEDPKHQEERRSKKRPTIPRNDIAYVPGDEEIGIYALGLQEIVNVGSAIEAIRPYSDPLPAKRWREAIESGLPPGYRLVVEQQLIGLLLLIYASPVIAPQISHVSATSVGTGLGGIMGNKGAVTARILLGETTRMVFINSHLTAGTEKTSLERRNWDAQQVVSRTRFEPIPVFNDRLHKGEAIGEEDFAFWFGDLNYRLEDIPGEDVRRLLRIHIQKEYEQADVSRQALEQNFTRSRSPVVIRGSPDEDVAGDNISKRMVEDSSSRLSDPIDSQPFPGSFPEDLGSSNYAPDPASLETTLQSLLPHDQLHQQMRSEGAFCDGWREGPITFLPTYKYDAGSIGMFDSSEKRRGPSWCDRILYRTREDREKYQLQVRERMEAQQRDQELRERGVDKAADEEESVLFDYDPDADAANDIEDPASESGDVSTLVETQVGAKDRIHMDVYTSHQRVLSSDHKPLDAVFSLTYDAVDAEKKALINTEVARELDKAENEGRPVVTVVADQNNAPSSTPESVDFGHVKYDSPKTRSITVANTGRVPATFGFAPRGIGSEGEGSVTPKWLSVGFENRSIGTVAVWKGLQDITLRPGDTITIHLTAHINEIAMVRRLNEQLDSLEDILILRVQSGRDHFIPLRGEWVRSAFGHSIEKLVRVPEGGIRKLQNQHLHDSNRGHDEVKWSSPKEIFRLTEAVETLTERSIAEWGMTATGQSEGPPWTSPGWPFEGFTSSAEQRIQVQEGIKECLDTDQSLESTSTNRVAATAPLLLESVAETLLAFLESLEDGIVPRRLWADNESDITTQEKSKTPSENLRLACLERLQALPAHSISMTLILAMLIKIVDEISQTRSFTAHQQDHRELTALREQREVRYAEIFARVVVRMSETAQEKDRKIADHRRKVLMEALIKGSRPPA